MWVPYLSTAEPRGSTAPLMLHYMVTQCFRKAKPQAWVSELLGAVQEGMPSTPSRHLAPVPPTPHFSHTQQWGSSPTIIYTEKAGPGGDTQNAGLRPGKGRDESLPSPGAGMRGCCQPNLESGLRIQIQA